MTRSKHRALAQAIGAMQALVARWRAPGVKPDLELFDALLRRIELIAQLEREHAKGEQMIAETRAALGRMKTSGPRALEALATAVEELAEFYWWHLHPEEDLASNVKPLKFLVRGEL
jgi:hypothetical protein